MRGFRGLRRKRRGKSKDCVASSSIWKHSRLLIEHQRTIISEEKIPTRRGYFLDESLRSTTITPSPPSWSIWEIAECVTRYGEARQWWMLTWSHSREYCTLRVQRLQSLPSSTKNQDFCAPRSTWLKPSATTWDKRFKTTSAELAVSACPTRNYQCKFA